MTKISFINFSPEGRNKCTNIYVYFFPNQFKMNNYIFFLLLIFISCTESSRTKQVASNPIVEKKPAQVTSKAVVHLDSSTNNVYAWLEKYDFKENIVNRIAPPKGFKRKEVVKNSFADWLRHLPLKPKGAKVHLYNGELKYNQNVHVAVVDIDVGHRDLQQCADAVMRLKAEYHYGKKEYKNIHFNFTSGDKVSFEDWRKGKRPIISGSKVSFTPASSQSDNSYRNFKKYLTQIFSYAGTASLEKELLESSLKDIQIGDVFIQGGFPGHAVIVADLVENEKGEKQFLLLQSYMPAQEIHVLKNPNNENTSPWYDADFDSDLDTPEWGFTVRNLRRF